MKIPAILLVDDERGQRDNIKSYLEPRIKCNIAEAESAEEAVTYIKNNPCDLMVLDIKMPGGSGVEVLDAAKDKPMVILVYTNWDSLQVLKQCRARGVKDYVAKSESLQVIGERIIKRLKDIKKYFPV